MPDEVSTPVDERDSDEGSVPEEAVHIERTALGGYVGFDTVKEQLVAKAVKRGFELNILVCGQSGLGKSTFIRTLFHANVIDSKGSKKPSEHVKRTTELETRTHMLDENGVRLKLTIIDTPGFGENLNNEKCYETIVKYLNDQHAKYHQEEIATHRKRVIPDNRVHVCLYFIPPTGTSLKQLDLDALKHISQVVNLVPVIAKADSLTLKEREKFKKKLQEDFDYHKIQVYPFSRDYHDAEESTNNAEIRKMMPFAVVGSDETVTIDGKAVRGRRLPHGVVNVDDPTHSDFKALQDFLMQTHLQDLIETTREVHFETIRTNLLLKKKDKKKSTEDKEKKASKARI